MAGPEPASGQPDDHPRHEDRAIGGAGIHLGGHPEALLGGCHQAGLQSPEGRDEGPLRDEGALAQLHFEVPEGQQGE